MSKTAFPARGRGLPGGSTSTGLRRALALAAVALAAGWSPVRADDRDLLRDSSKEPYVFIMLDLSGSMHWEVGDTLPTLRADAPSSKMYQAKEALYTVVDELDNIQFGFGTFNQDELRVVSKHWLYEAAEPGITLTTVSGPDPVYPAEGDEHVFGREYECRDDASGNDDGCSDNDAAQMDDEWEYRRMQLYPKLGINGNDSTDFWIRYPDGDRFRVTFSRVSGTLGDASIEVSVRIRRTNSSSFDQTKTMTFRRVQGFLSWDNGAARWNSLGDQEGYFDQLDRGSGNSEIADASDLIADFWPSNTTCFGWDPNDDASDDDWNSYSLKETTSGSGYTSYGDVIPLSWTDDNRQRILERLAPNLLMGEATPDFSIARYFEDTPTAGSLRYVPALEAVNGTVLAPVGSTPLGGSIQDFRLWFNQWKRIAEDNDPDWGCRNVYLLMLTDGNESCNSNAGGQATALLSSQGVKTFVIGLGVAGSVGNDTLDDIADRGGTGDPYRPQNSAELVAVLRDIFESIREETAAFASAAVPSVQANVSDKLFLSSFTPVNDNSFWSGHLDSFLKPLPVTDAGLPDRSRVCGPTDRAACRAWDAGDEILLQAPEETIDPITLIGSLTDPFLGGTENERRVLYHTPVATVGQVPMGRSLFWADALTSALDWQNLLEALGYTFDPLDLLDFAATKLQGSDILRDTLKIKHETITQVDDDGNPIDVPITYLLGDIFHSDPLVVSNPNNFFYFNADLFSNGELCDDDTNPNPGYRCFFEKHAFRRKFVVFGADDGQLHGFDAGVLRERFDGPDVVREFDNGTGRELFSILPRASMPTLRAVAENTGHQFTVDSPPVLADVFIDPAHAGVPDPTQREWRTLVLAGLREGGRGVFALDVTQPDVLEKGLDTARDLTNIPQVLDGTDPDVVDYVPSCWDGNPAGFDPASEVGCGPLSFPQMLWEFTDTSDDDSNGFPDLGDTWSIPNTGLVQVREGTDVVDKFVAIFGGGIDPSAGTPSGAVGNWLYMVDIETGKLLYKRELFGSAPSEPAAVDTDSNLYIDTIYIGTTAGFLYKADVSQVVDLDANGEVPASETAWDPFQIFDTGGRPIFFPPSVFYVPDKGGFGVAFGTGDREDLWSTDTLGGRYYVFLDLGIAAGDPVLTEASLTQVSLTDDDTADQLLLVNGGWFFPLELGERLITKSLSVSGIVFFNSFMPEGAAVIGGDAVCARFGESRIFIVSAINGNGYGQPPDDPVPCGNGRCSLVPKFVTNPFLEPSTTQNQLPTGQDPNYSDTLDDRLKAILESLKELFPNACRYSNHTQNLKTIRSDTGVVFIAPIPTCMMPHNWTPGL